MSEPISVYLYKGYSGVIGMDEFFVYTIEDEQKPVSNYHFPDIDRYAQHLIGEANKRNAPLQPIWDVPSNQKSVIDSSKFTLLTKLEPQDIKRLASELKIALSGK